MELLRARGVVAPERLALHCIAFSHHSPVSCQWSFVNAFWSFGEAFVWTLEKALVECLFGRGVVSKLYWPALKPLGLELGHLMLGPLNLNLDLFAP